MTISDFTDQAPRDGAATLKAIEDHAAEPARPLLLTGGTVISMNRLLGDWERADVLLGGSVIVGVGPGLLTAAGDDNMIVIDCSGMVVFPASVDFAEPGNAESLTPGDPADVAVVRIDDPEGTSTAPVAYRGGHLELAVTAGRVTFYRGRDAKDAPGRADAADDGPGEHPYIGLWVDENDFLRQELLSNGRYDEARGDRTSAYQGRYWIDGTRIEYLDDLGFWAYGEFHDGVLDHAGYRLTRL